MDNSSQQSKSNINSNGDSQAARSFLSNRNAAARTGRLMTDEEISQLDPEIAQQLNFNLFGRTWEETLADFPKVNRRRNRQRRENEAYEHPFNFDNPNNATYRYPSAGYGGGPPSESTAYGNSAQASHQQFPVFHNGSPNYNGTQGNTSPQNSNEIIRAMQNYAIYYDSIYRNENGGTSHFGSGSYNQGPIMSEGNGDMGQQQQLPASKDSDARNGK